MSVETIKEVTVGENTYQVADLPDNIQKLVQFYEFAVGAVQTAEKEFVVSKAGANALGADIGNAITQWQAALASAAEATEEAEPTALVEGTVV